MTANIGEGEKQRSATALGISGLFQTLNNIDNRKWFKLFQVSEGGSDVTEHLCLVFRIS